MTLTSIGDLAQGFVLRRQTTALQQQMGQLTREISSGQVADISAHLSGRFTALSDVEHQLTLQDGYRLATQQAGTDAAAMQAALEQIQTGTSDLANAALTSASNATGGVALSTVAKQAQNLLDSSVSALNTQVGGRSLFAGTEVTGPAVASPADILDGLRTALAGASSVAEVMTRADAFFDSPTGPFRQTLYQGSDTGPSPYRLGQGESVTLDLRADDPALRAQIKDTALAALVSDPALALGAADRAALLNSAGTALRTAQDGMTGLRAKLGTTEGRIEKTATRIGAEVTSLGLARNALVSADPYEASSRLKEVQFQLDAVLTLTARSTRLNLLNALP